MSLKNSADRWGTVSQLLHWTIAVLILSIGAVGLMMGDLPRSPKWFWVYTAHKSLGLTVLVLVLVRIGWRLYAGAPAPVAGTPRWQARAASLTHGAIYLLILTHAAVGLALRLGKRAASVPLVRPYRGPQACASRRGAGRNHARNPRTAVLGADRAGPTHAAAALWHHFVQRDATLARMLPRRWLSLPPRENTP
ncbi:cytochrome b [Pseudoxanthomonas sp. NC8]|nr:cytochrome b [Pseudoxanthomonas sp. NC8]